jgi:hypothetical protein
VDLHDVVGHAPGHVEDADDLPGLDRDLHQALDAPVHVGVVHVADDRPPVGGQLNLSPERFSRFEVPSSTAPADAGHRPALPVTRIRAQLITSLPPHP